ncbi:Hsp20/alpha crystallin family protein [Paenibacillus ihumii]|uniref:Hsp20/alpha crystallin family protein n=1 Tax=Paenibacillus ihumii TaxID=687436 RepID=UPI0006D7D0AE|nr:Hsp20/alpha crystallin family protein [Paenibacillus ihumii]
MPLIPYDPFHQLSNMRRDIDRFFSEELPFLKSETAARFGQLNIDIYETDREVVAACDIPGLEKKEDVNISIDNNVLTIGGTVNKVHEVKEEQIHRQERFVGRFQRSVSLPAAVSAEGVTATYKNGVLEIRMPKASGDNKKRIDVQFH